MSNIMYEEISIERTIKDYFGVDLDIRQAIVFKVPVSPTSQATLFLNSKKQLYLFINGQSRLVFGDIKKIISKMGLVADKYLPPKNRPNYFDEVGQAKFFQVFPGRKNISPEDLIFYRTLAPYCPALVLISEIRDGHVYQYDSDSNTKWRIATKFSYRRIKTSLNM